MGYSLVMQAVAGKSKKGAHMTESVGVENRALLEFAQAANGRLDQPEDSSLDWTEGVDYEGPISPRDCYPPDELIKGLVWLRSLAAKGDKSARDVWKAREKGPFTSDAFLRSIAYDLDSLQTLAQGAKARGEKLILLVVP